MTDSLIWRAVSQRRILFLIFVVLGLLMVPIILAVVRPTYHADAKLMLISENTSRDPLVLSRDVPSLALSHYVLERVQKITKTKDSIPLMKRHLAVKVGELSNILSVSYQSHDSQTAQNVANAAADQTVVYFNRLSTQQYDHLITYLRHQMVSQRNSIEDLDRQVQRAASVDSFASTDKSIDTITTRLDDLQGKLGDAMAGLTADQAIAAANAQQPREVAGIMHDQQLSSDPLYQNLRAAQAHDAAQLGQIKAQYTDRYPGLPSLDEQVRRESATLDERKTAVLAGGLSSSPTYAQTILDQRKGLALVAGDQARVAQYSTQIQEQQRRLADLSNTGVSVAVLRTERDTAMASYTALATQLSTVLANQAEANSLGSLVVIDRAGEASALFESLVSRVIIGVVAVVAMALLLVIIVEVVDPRLRTPTDIERLYGRPVIATVGV